jgi:hypothetical protein
MTIRIYCGKNADRSFPKEHVVPKAFGRFRETMTSDCVCAGCDSFFNRELDCF